MINRLYKTKGIKEAACFANLFLYTSVVNNKTSINNYKYDGESRIFRSETSYFAYFHKVVQTVF